MIWNEALVIPDSNEKIVPNASPAELFMSICHWFEAGIANVISRLKWMKNNIIYEK